MLAEVAGKVEDTNVGVGLGEFVEDGGRAVGAGVVDDDPFPVVGGEFVGENRGELFEERAEVGGFVVAGSDDGDGFGGL